MHQYNLLLSIDHKYMINMLTYAHYVVNFILMSFIFRICMYYTVFMKIDIFNHIFPVTITRNYEINYIYKNMINYPITIDNIRRVHVIIFYDRNRLCGPGFALRLCNNY